MSTPTGADGGQQPPDPNYGAQGYGAQGYGEQGYPPEGPYAAPQAPKNGLGITALVLGIVGILTCWLLIGGLLGLIAIILGAVGVSRASKRIATNKGVAIGGIVTGAIGLILTVLLVVGGVNIFFSSGGGDLYNCLQKAGANTSAQQECQNQFQQGVQRRYGS